MRDHRDVGVVDPLPGRLLRVGLQPGGAKGNGIWPPPPAPPIHAVGDPVEPTVLDQLGQGTRCHARGRSLAPSHQAPLIIRDAGQTLKGVCDTAEHTVVWILCSALNCCLMSDAAPAASVAPEDTVRKREFVTYSAPAGLMTYVCSVRCERANA